MPTPAEDGALTREEGRLRGLLYLNAAQAIARVAGYVARGSAARQPVPSLGNTGANDRRIARAMAGVNSA